MGELKCLLCYNNLSEKCLERKSNLICYDDPGNNNDSLNNQLESIFLVRKILEIPESICCSFLKDFGDPSLWYCICTSCLNLVGKAREIFDQIVIFTQRYKKLRKQIKNKITSSVNCMDTDLENEQKCEVSDIIRSYVGKASDSSRDFQKCQNLNSCGNEDMFNWFESPVSQNEQDWNTENDFALKDETLDCKVNVIHNENYFGDDEPNNEIDEVTNDSLNLSGEDEEEISNSRKIQLIENKKSPVLLKGLPKKKISRATYPKDGPLECKLCDKSFSSSSNLFRHIRLHNGVKPHKCDVCGKCFAQSSGLKDHQRTHTGEKPYVCRFCGKSTSLATDLKKHVIRMHPNAEEKYKKSRETNRLSGKNKNGKIRINCDICQKPFTDSNKLQDHVLTHSSVKPYHCDICDKSYSKKHDLKNHQITHKGEKLYVCDICGKAFGCFSILNKHLRIHSGLKPFKCKTCDKSFFQVGNLNAHLRVHTGEKRYKCDICGKSFVNSSYLKVHTNIHTGEKPFTCEFCGRSFSIPVYLRKHLKRNHSKIST